MYIFDIVYQTPVKTYICILIAYIHNYFEFNWNNPKQFANININCISILNSMFYVGDVSYDN